MAPSPVLSAWCSVLAFGKTYDLAKSTDQGVLVSMRGEWALVPWSCVERVRPRASYHDYGTAPWQSCERAA